MNHLQTLADYLRAGAPNPAILADYMSKGLEALKQIADTDPHLREQISTARWNLQCLTVEGRTKIVATAVQEARNLEAETGVNVDWQDLAQLPRLDQRFFDAAAQSLAQVLKAVSGETPKTAAIEMVLGEESRQVLDIANSIMTVDDKMRQICNVDHRCVAWDSAQWADLFGVSQQAIRKTEYWRNDRRRLLG